MKETNRRLVDANKIRNGYVFRYMALSVHYIDKISETRNEIRTIAKSEGLDAVMTALRSPSVMYKEYENYYRIFDETFLGIFRNQGQVILSQAQERYGFLLLRPVLP